MGSRKETVVKNILAAALFALVAATALVQPVSAQANTFGNSRYYPEDAIVDWSGERFTIIRIDSFEPTSDERLRLESWMEANPDQIDALQNSIEENSEFAAALRARSVQLNNVVAVQRALSGNLIVFLR
jgi:hypothetical protein